MTKPHRYCQSKRCMFNEVETPEDARCPRVTLPVTARLTVSDRKSTSGYMVKLGDSLINWTSRKQHSVALSTCEAEYIALSSASQECVWMRRMLRDLGQHIDEPTPIKSDNMSGISWADGEKIPWKRAKHIDVRFHYVRELINLREVEIGYVPTHENDADILTKPLGRVAFRTILDRIGIEPKSRRSDKI